MENNAFYVALSLLLNFDAALFQIVALSLQISLLAVLVAAVLGFPLGAAVALWRFPGRGGLIVVLNALMGLPPVVAGLIVYLSLSRAGPLGEWGLLFTPGAMVIAQVLLVLPILAALSRQKVEELLGEYREQFVSLGMSRSRMVPTLLWDARFALLTILLAGFGRASAEVGAVMMVGGNIEGVTRVMTTSIVLETGKGNLPLALGLGVVLLSLIMLVNACAYWVGEMTRRRTG
ncbi:MULTISPECIES: ABC transporter permease [unclassified Marinobacter]|uniref:ABC transporter permease n=1 Tax=unclassified Marinobacter TaxID=83889 RepID=UPI0026E3A849|nr:MULTISPECIES: ABC transporter permease [unclassified Marinobacter]MDO6443490.1 ABC transporter permease [Marinobacter sp. 2_MG-2023]MDO6824125.1 ABC transporter permease [Marinobacter sp. 1_MG-2023]